MLRGPSNWLPLVKDSLVWGAFFLDFLGGATWDVVPGMLLEPTACLLALLVGATKSENSDVPETNLEETCFRLCLSTASKSMIA